MNEDSLSTKIFNNYMRLIQEEEYFHDKMVLLNHAEVNRHLSDEDYEELEKFVWDEEKQRYETSKKKRLRSNPLSNETEIYGDILAIEAKKGQGSLWPNELFRHDFKGKGSKIYGLRDGSLLIKPKKGKRLWKNFNY